MNIIGHLMNSPVPGPGTGLIYTLFFVGTIALGFLVWQIHALDKLIDKLPKKKNFEKRAVLTPNETEFFSRLRKAIPELDVYPQMAMSALIKPAVPESDPNYWNYRKKFDRKVCDFVISKKGCHPAAGVIVVVELDDKTHNKEKDAWRDQILLSAGIRTIRYESKAKPTPAKIRKDIAALMKR